MQSQMDGDNRKRKIIWRIASEVERYHLQSHKYYTQCYSQWNKGENKNFITKANRIKDTNQTIFK